MFYISIQSFFISIFKESYWNFVFAIFVVDSQIYKELKMWWTKIIQANKNNPIRNKENNTFSKNLNNHDSIRKMTRKMKRIKLSSIRDSSPKKSSFLPIIAILRLSPLFPVYQENILFIYWPSFHFQIHNETPYRWRDKDLLWEAHKIVWVDCLFFKHCQL